MIFDITDIATGVSTRYKPRAKARCTGEVRYRGEEVASLKLLAITVTEDLVGGKFAIEWHRMEPEEKILDALTLVVHYQELGQAPQTWTIPDVQIMTEGICWPF